MILFVSLSSHSHSLSFYQFPLQMLFSFFLFVILKRKATLNFKLEALRMQTSTKALQFPINQYKLTCSRSTQCLFVAAVAAGECVCVLRC